jgi:peptide/nickel transport system substrate-binding protein
MTDATRRSILLGAGALMTAPHAARGQRAEPVLRVVAPWEYTSNDPTDIGYILTRMQVAEGLVGVEPDGRVVGMVAERWTVDEDRLT